MVRMIGDEFLTEERDRKYYADHYTCCPPPLFIILITLVERASVYPVADIGSEASKSLDENVIWFIEFPTSDRKAILKGEVLRRSANERVDRIPLSEDKGFLNLT
ncbi:RHBL3 protein, partial [Acromyrmex charruanus]